MPDLVSEALRNLDQTLADLDRLDCEESLLKFVRYMWPVVEPATDLKEGDVLTAICAHLEAVSDGRITRLLINVPPGSMKSLLTDVFWPAWEWTTRPYLRYVAFSYSAGLTERDNVKFRELILSERYQRLWGRASRSDETRFDLVKVGERRVSNTATGYKFATSVGGIGTGERGDRVLLDDPHSVSEAESETIRNNTTEWFLTAMSNRLNNMMDSAIVVIMQRVHEDDVSGVILAENMGYCHLMIPAEFEADRKFVNEIGWSDWRTIEGESFWPERFPIESMEPMKKRAYAFAGQYQQRPEPKGGGILKRDYWVPWYDAVTPVCSYIVASVDPAYGEKQENDYSALTIWGVYTKDYQPRLILLCAWRDRVPLNRLVKVTAAHARHFKAHRILIEAKASGLSLEQELRRLYIGADKTWGVTMINPGHQDKVARVHAISHLFEDGLVSAPFDADEERPIDFADMVIEECAKFPRASHDDLVDSTSQALRHVRDLGILIRPPELKEEQDLEKAYKRELEPLYDV